MTVKKSTKRKVTKKKVSIKEMEIIDKGQLRLLDLGLATNQRETENMKAYRMEQESLIRTFQHGNRIMVSMEYLILFITGFIAGLLIGYGILR